ncbi:MAG TPA: DMT family transporter, partial [Candidatus Micrarchaeota archaeon]|nr:DMT family transporter [Candidatus Micrarchaeota archaeon]
MDTKQAGILFALAAMLTSAVLPVSSKFSLGYLNPLLFSSVTLLIAFALSYAYLLMKGRHAEVMRAIPRTLKLSAFSYFAFSALFFFAQKSLSAVDSTLLFQSEPFFALAFSAWLLSEKISLP